MHNVCIMMHFYLPVSVLFDLPTVLFDVPTVLFAPQSQLYVFPENVTPILSGYIVNRHVTVYIYIYIPVVVSAPLSSCPLFSPP